MTFFQSPRARCHRTGEGCVLADMSSSLAYTRSGAGAPLVLLHALGTSRRSWDPVIPALARRFDVRFFAWRKRRTAVDHKVVI